MRFFIRLSYLGTKYHGWQYQPNAMSVQEKLETALSTVLQIKTNIIGAGRTDTGVHAKNYIAHFDMDNSKFANDIPLLIYKLNSLLPKDIAIHDIYKVADDAHARFDAKKRSYKYFISTAKDPFIVETSWLRLGKLDIDKMNKAGQILCEYSDFTSFAKLHADAKTNICDVSKAKWTQENNHITFEISADRFLRNMVRAIVGTMIEVGTNKISLDEFINIIEIKNRNNAGVSAAAEGLFLVKIEY
ncbi:MAG: tRNA pseudouridine(38-40) synthase TruA [Bacteroidales bacterium]|nr:tRNA pseudouridine(38-40) synthase TruA [Bacteroidales bacterium]